jgi:hypothetical protein
VGGKVLPAKGKKSLPIDEEVHKNIAIMSATRQVTMSDLIAEAWKLYTNTDDEPNDRRGAAKKIAVVDPAAADYLDFLATGSPEVVRVVQDLVAAHAKARRLKGKEKVG